MPVLSVHASAGHAQIGRCVLRTLTRYVVNYLALASWIDQPSHHIMHILQVPSARLAYRHALIAGWIRLGRLAQTWPAATPRLWPRPALPSH